MTKDVEFLIDVALSANNLITDDFVVNAKDDKGDLVTSFDLSIEKYIISRINVDYPNFDIVSEELNTSSVVTDNCFIIDPIDGTVNFAHNAPDWCIQIAMIKDGSPCASVIYVPKYNEMYSADTDHAYLNGKILHINPNPNIKSGIFGIEGKVFTHTMDAIIPHIRHPRKMGSTGVSFTYTASSRAVANIYTYDNVWDYAPGMFIVEKAGGYIIDKPNKHISACSKDVAELVYKCCCEAEVAK